MCACSSGSMRLHACAAYASTAACGAAPPHPVPRAVTLFEGGRVYGQDVINELIDELHASVGERLELAHASSSRWGMGQQPLGHGAAAAGAWGCSRWRMGLQPLVEGLGVCSLLAQGLLRACPRAAACLPPGCGCHCHPQSHSHCRLPRLGAEMSAGFEGEMRSLVDYAR